MRKNMSEYDIHHILTNMMNIIFAHILAHIQNIHDIHFAYLNIVNLLVNMTRIPQALNAPKMVVFIHVHIHLIFTSYSY